MVQIREGCICITFDAHNISEIYENECSNFFEIKKFLKTYRRFKVKKIFELLEEFWEEHPAILPILISAVVGFVTTILFNIFK